MQSLFVSLITLSSILIACSSNVKTDNKIDEVKPAQETPKLAIPPKPATTEHLKVVTLADAEKILGERAHITDSTMSTQSNIVVYKSTYTANAGNDATRGSVTFLFEDYKLQGDATTKYGFIKASHEGKAGFEELRGLADEAYFHSDKKNTHIIMLRKGTKVVTMKVNKITPKTSEKAFREVAAKIAVYGNE